METTANTPDQPSVLIVEDDEDLVLLYQLNVKRWNLPVTYRFARDGRAALTDMSQDPPSFVIADLSMPDVDGFNMLESLNRVGVSIPIVVVTGLANYEIKKLGPLADELIILKKPVDFDFLRKLVMMTLGVRPLKANA
jgi:DNA-binding NtrC family response regulator